MRLLIVDDRRPSADALCVALGQDRAITSCESCPSVEAALPLVAEGRYDVVVLLVSEGTDGAAAVREQDPTVRVVLVTESEDAEVFAEALAAEVDVFSSKDASLNELRDAVVSGSAPGRGGSTIVASVADEVRRGHLSGGPAVELTPREREVLELLAQGVLVKDIAQQLGIQTETCRGYVKTLLMKLDARSQLQAVVIAGRMGLLDEEQSFG